MALFVFEVQLTYNIMLLPVTQHGDLDEKLLLNDKMQDSWPPGEMNSIRGPETRLDCSEILCNKVLLKYKGDRESF